MKHWTCSIKKWFTGRWWTWVPQRILPGRGVAISKETKTALQAKCSSMLYGDPWISHSFRRGGVILIDWFFLKSLPAVNLPAVLIFFRRLLMSYLCFCISVELHVILACKESTSCSVSDVPVAPSSRKYPGSFVHPHGAYFGARSSWNQLGYNEAVL